MPLQAKWETGKTFDLGDAAGEMGDSLTAIDLGTGRTATAIAASGATCAVLDNSSIKCWGTNASGQLGLGDTTNRGNTVQGDGSSQMGDNLPSIDLGSGRTARGVITGDYHTCSIMDNSSIKCWGYNASGQLGIGDTDSRGNGANEMGDNLPSISF
jgi:Alpha-tubulin suppressor and related RCC1 domain-containing proteins